MLRRALIRGEALLLALIVVATPLVLLARPLLNSHSKCSGICCRQQKSHSAPRRPDSRPDREAKLTCQRGIAAHIAMCIAPSGPHDQQSVFAPLPPVVLAEPETIDGPQRIAEVRWPDSHFASAGFVSIPFEPPRS